MNDFTMTPGLTPSQVDARAGKLFATDAAAALGADKYKTPYQLWLEKRGEAPAFTGAGDGPAYFGLHFQESIGKLYTERTGLPLIREPRTLTSREHAWMGAHMDYRVAGYPQMGVEIKFLDPVRRKEFGMAGTDEMPTQYLLQCLHQMVVADLQRVDLPVQFGNREFGVWTVERNDRALKTLVEREREFMGCVHTGTPPEPVSAADVARMHADTGKALEADAALQSLIEIYAEMKSRVDDTEKALTEVRNRICVMMGDASIVTHQGRVILTWKADNGGKPVRRMVEGSTDRLRKEYPEVYAELSAEVDPSRRFLCKL